MNNYEVLSQIGKGNFGTITKVLRKSDKKILVWKELDYGQMSEKEKQQLVSEVNILRELKNQNIVRYHDRIIDKKNAKIYIIMEYCEGGDLGQLIKRCKKTKETIAEDVIWKILTQVIIAVHYIHNFKSGKILHRDIKPSNVFLDKDNNVKLGDFGLSRELSDQSKFAYSNVGTPYYMSPEQIDQCKYNEKSDIWSLGCFLYELVTFHPPFEAKNQMELAMKIKSGNVKRINKNYSEELWRVITWMLNIDYNLRPSSEQLLNIPEISVRLREKRIKETLSKIKVIEEKFLFYKLGLEIEKETLALKKKNEFILKIINEIGKALDKNFLQIKIFDYDSNIEDFINLFNYFDSFCDKEKEKEKSIAIHSISIIILQIDNLSYIWEKIINQVKQIIIQDNYLKDKERRMKLISNIMDDLKLVLGEKKRNYLDSFTEKF